VHRQHEARPEPGPQRVDVVDLLRDVVVADDEPVDLPRFLVERLDHPDARDRVRQDVRHPRPFPPCPDEEPVQRLSVPIDQPAEDRHRQRHHETEPPVEREQHGAEADEHHERKRNVHDAKRDELPQAVGVRRDARDQASRLLAREEREARPLDVRVQLGPEVARHQLA
jgi:hypothetical protein